MYRTPFVLTCVAVATANMQALPTGCREDVHCPSGSYCEPQQLACRQCLNCEDLKREASQIATSCITSVAECGTCFAGLVESKLNIGGICVPPNTQTEPPPPLPPPYDWAAIIISLLLFAFLICVALLVLLRNFKTYRLRTSTSATVQSPCEEVVVPASAPLEPPPPYNSVAVLPSANSLRLQEESLPFIKPIHTSRPADERQSANHQAARVFNNPTYEQEGSLPPSYETVSVSNETNEGLPPTHGANYNTVEVNDNEPPAPAEFRNGVPQVHAPTPIRHRVRQDSNNNSDDSEESYTGSCNPSFLAQNSCPFVINVIKNITTVQQHNDLSQNI